MNGRAELLAGLLVLVLGSGVVAQAPSPTGLEAGVWLGVPEAKVALTIPAGWNVSVDYRPAEPPVGQSMPVDERWAVLVAGDDSATLNGCRLMRYPTGGLRSLEFASGLLMPEQPTMTPMQLDAGDAIRLDLDLGEGYVAQQYVSDRMTASISWPASRKVRQRMIAGCPSLRPSSSCPPRSRSSPLHAVPVKPATRATRPTAHTNSTS